MGQSVVHFDIDITTTSREVLHDNPLRRYALLVNDSDSAFYISLGQAAAANKGIRINSAGGSYEINSTNLFTGPVHAISTAVTKKLMVTEW